MYRWRLANYNVIGLAVVENLKDISFLVPSNNSKNLLKTFVWFLQSFDFCRVYICTECVVYWIWSVKIFPMFRYNCSTQSQDGLKWIHTCCGNNF